MHSSPLLKLMKLMIMKEVVIKCKMQKRCTAIEILSVPFEGTHQTLNYDYSLLHCHCQCFPTN